jgi:RNA polymerase-interacting CarD/CdnL/TRCF family regulator
MNNRDKKPNSSKKNVDICDNYVRPSKRRVLPAYQFQNSEPQNNEDSKLNEQNESNLEEGSFFSIPECVRELLKITPEQVSEVEPRNIRFLKQTEPSIEFEYNFINKEKYSKKEVEKLMINLDTYNQHKYIKFKKILNSKTGVQPVGEIFKCGDIDVDLEYTTCMKETAKLVENIKKSAKKRLFRQTNDSITNSMGASQTVDSRFVGRQNERPQSESNYTCILLII